MVRWVRDFLLFARKHGGYTFEQTLDMFLAEVRSRICLKFTPFSWYNKVTGKVRLQTPFHRGILLPEPPLPRVLMPPLRTRFRLR